MPTFLNTDDIATWMQDEGFDELVLLSCKPTAKAPKPRATKAASVPEVVTIEVGIVDLEHEGPKERFQVWRFEASEIVQWHGTGALDKHLELTLDRAADVDAPIALRFFAGATAVLACGRLDVVDAGPRLRVARPRPWQHTLCFYLHGDTTMATLLDGMGMTGARVQSFDDRPVIVDAATTLTSLREHSGRAWRMMDGEREVATFYGSNYLPYWLVSLGRGSGATDDEWDRCWAVPITLGRDEVWSRNKKSTKEAWATVEWRKGLLQPPRGR